MNTSNNRKGDWVRETIREILQETKKAWDPKALTLEVERRGWRSNSKTFEARVKNLQTCISDAVKNGDERVILHRKKYYLTNLNVGD